jgi:hypothetical protein
MVAIPFPYGSAPGFEFQEGAGRLVNCFAEPLGEGRQDTKRVRVPGMTKYLTSNQSGFRGMFLVGNILYVAFHNELYKYIPAIPPGAPPQPLVAHLATTNSLPGTLPVTFARNNQSPPDVMVVTQENGAFQIVESPTAEINPFGIPGAAPNSVFGLDGYLVFTTLDGHAWASDLNSTTMNPLSFGAADAKPDGLLRGVAFSGRALFFGTQSLEIWIDVGAQPFPFQRSTTTPMGLLASNAVAGWEDGFGDTLLWVANDYTVRELQGYSAVKVSTPDLDRLIYRDPNPQNLLANVHMVDGHAMWTITGTNYSWSYDIGAQRWHERASYLATRWRGLQTIAAYNQWLIGDRISGNVYVVDPTNYREDQNPLIVRVESGSVENFPARVRVALAQFKLETGVGIAPGIDPIEIDPTLEISWSDDGGNTWSNPLFRKIGKQANGKQVVQVTRLGMSSYFGRRWRVQMADPVYFSLMAGDQSAEMRLIGAQSGLPGQQ